MSTQTRLQHFINDRKLGLSLKQISSREFNRIKDRVYSNLIYYSSGNDEKVYEASHASFVLKKLKQEYHQFLLSDKTVVDSSWDKKDLPQIIWWCWLQGEDKIPDLSKFCLNSLKKNIPHYDIRIITLDNLKKYIDIPSSIYLKYEAGWISGAAFSDIVRLGLLSKYGGVWIDSTVYCSNDNLVKILEKNNMFVYQNVMTANSDVIKMSNWLMASKKDNPYMIDAFRLLRSYYKEHNYTEDYFICHLILTLLSEKYSDIWNDIDIFNNINPHMLQYVLNDQFSLELFNRIMANSSFHKLNRHIKLLEGDTFYNYIKSRENYER